MIRACSFSSGFFCAVAPGRHTFPPLSVDHTKKGRKDRQATWASKKKKRPKKHPRIARETSLYFYAPCRISPHHRTVRKSYLNRLFLANTTGFNHSSTSLHALICSSFDPFRTSEPHTQGVFRLPKERSIAATPFHPKHPLSTCSFEPRRSRHRQE